MNFRRKSYQNTISNAPFISYRQTFRYNLWSYQVEFQTAKKLSMQLIEIQCKLWEHFNWYNVKRQPKFLRPCPSNLPLPWKKPFCNSLKGRHFLYKYQTFAQSSFENINITSIQLINQGSKYKPNISQWMHWNNELAFLFTNTYIWTFSIRFGYHK